MFEPELLTTANGSMRRDAKYFIDECSEEIGNMSGRCIDVGTGAGDVTVDFILPMLIPNSTLLCSDISEAMVDYAKKRYGNNDRLTFMKLDIETVELPKHLVGQFDHLTSLYCLHWCYDLRRAFENIYALLRPGGTAFVTFLSSYRGLDALMELKTMPKYQSYMTKNEQPRQDLMTLLKDVGFQVKLCSCRPMTYIWDTMASLTGFLLAVNPVKMDDMPTDLRNEYVRDLTRLFIEYEIVFENNRGKKNERSILCSYSTFVACVKKPRYE